MTIDTARQICQTFANKHKVIFEDHGEVGFGRPCVGFTSGARYIDYNPRNNSDYELVWPDARPIGHPHGVEAYHKHDCLAVLVADSYDAAILQLATWVEALEAQGELEIVTYATGATGLQAAISGIMGRAIRFKEPAKV
jgi:hypothetical protein